MGFYAARRPWALEHRILFRVGGQAATMRGAQDAPGQTVPWMRDPTECDPTEATTVTRERGALFDTRSELSCRGSDHSFCIPISCIRMSRK